VSVAFCMRMKSSELCMRMKSSVFSKIVQSDCQTVTDVVAALFVPQAKFRASRLPLKKSSRRERHRTWLSIPISHNFNLANPLHKISLVAKMSAAQLLNPKAESRVQPSDSFDHFRCANSV
jgi:hypothetical protein